MVNIVGNKAADRYWWFQWNSYEPDSHILLNRREKKALKNWYSWTDSTNSGIGECSIPMASMLTALINGNGIDSIVQIGHYTGYSSLFIASTLKRMGFKNRFISLDIDPWATQKAETLIKKAGLNDYVEFVVGDSRDAKSVVRVMERLTVKPKLIFIDSYHTYKVAKEEINLWFPQMRDGGLMLFHDTSDFAATFADLGDKGVNSAVTEYVQNNQISSINVNRQVHKGFDPNKLVYQDCCGLQILQKDFILPEGGK